MKKIFTLLLLSAFAVGVHAQTPTVKVPKRHYINFAYANQTLKSDEAGSDELKEGGFAAEFGSTFFFNGKKPILGMVRVGLDFTYLDLQYNNFKDAGENEEGEKESLHFANLGWQLGPSVTVTPFANLPFHAKAYVHYAPSCAIMAPGSFSDASYGYVGYVTGGLQASYMAFTLGVEFRGGKGDFNKFNLDEESLEGGNIKGDKFTAQLPSTRLIFGFRF